MPYISHPQLPSNNPGSRQGGRCSHPLLKEMEACRAYQDCHGYSRDTSTGGCQFFLGPIVEDIFVLFPRRRVQGGRWWTRDPRHSACSGVLFEGSSVTSLSAALGVLK